MGWESGVDKDFKQAPQFFWLFTIIIIISAGLILIPNAPLMTIMFISQVVNGAVLPFVLMFMIHLINDKNLMGTFVNGPTFNLIAWLTVVTMIVLTVIMTTDIAFPGLIKRLMSF